MKPKSYDSVDTDLGEHVLYTVVECSEEIHYVHDENVKYKKVVCDKRNLKKPRSVDIYSVSQGRIITRPITIEANDDLFSIESEVENVWRPPESGVITVDDDEISNSVNSNPTAVPLHFNCCKKQARVVVCVECGGTYHQNCFVANGGALRKDARVVCCEKKITETNHKIENDLRKKIIQEMDEKCEIMRENRALLKARVAALEKSSVPQEKLMKNLVQAMDDKCKVLTENKALLYEKISHLEKKPEVPVENAVSLFQKLISSDIFKRCANLLDSDQQVLSGGNLFNSEECSKSNDNNLVIAGSSTDSVKQMNLVTAGSSTDSVKQMNLVTAGSSTDSVKQMNLVTAGSSTDSVKQMNLRHKEGLSSDINVNTDNSEAQINLEQGCVSNNKSPVITNSESSLTESISENAPNSVQNEQMTISGNKVEEKSLSVRNNYEKPSFAQAKKKTRSAYFRGMSKYNGNVLNMYDQLNYIKHQVKSFKKYKADVSQKRQIHKTKRTKNVVPEQIPNKSGAELVRSDASKKITAEKESENIQGNESRSEKNTDVTENESKGRKVFTNNESENIGKKFVENGNKGNKNDTTENESGNKGKKENESGNKGKKENESGNKGKKDNESGNKGKKENESGKKEHESSEKAKKIVISNKNISENENGIKTKELVFENKSVHKTQKLSKHKQDTKLMSTPEIQSPKENISPETNNSSVDTPGKDNKKPQDYQKTDTKDNNNCSKNVIKINSPKNLDEIISKIQNRKKSPLKTKMINTAPIKILANKAGKRDEFLNKSLSSPQNKKRKLPTPSKEQIDIMKQKRAKVNSMDKTKTIEKHDDKKTESKKVATNLNIKERDSALKLTEIKTYSNKKLKPSTKRIEINKESENFEMSLTETNDAEEVDDGEHIHVDNVHTDDDTSTDLDPNLDESICVKEEIVEESLETTLVKDETSDYLLNEDTMSETSAVEYSGTCKKIIESPQKKNEFTLGELLKNVNNSTNEKEELTIESLLGPVIEGEKEDIKFEAGNNNNKEKLDVGNCTLNQNITSTPNLVKASTLYSPISEVGDTPKATTNFTPIKSSSFCNKSDVEKKKDVLKDSKAVRILDFEASSAKMLSVADIETTARVTPASENIDLTRPDINLLQVINFSNNEVNSTEVATQNIQDTVGGSNKNVINAQEKDVREQQGANKDGQNTIHLDEPMEVSVEDEVPNQENQKNKKQNQPNTPEKISQPPNLAIIPNSALLISIPSTSTNLNPTLHIINLQPPPSKNPVIVRPYCWASRLTCSEQAPPNQEVISNNQPGPSQRILPNDQPVSSQSFAPNDSSQRRYTIQVRRDLTIGEASMNEDSNQDSPRIGSIQVRRDLVQQSSDAGEPSGLIQVRKDLIQTSENLNITPGQIQVRRDLVENETQPGGQITVRKDLISGAKLKIRNDLLAKITVRKDLVQAAPSGLEENATGMVGSIKVRKDLQVENLEIDENTLNVPLNLSLETRSESSENIASTSENASSSQNKKYLKVRKDLVTSASSNNEIVLPTEDIGDSIRWSLKVRKDLHTISDSEDVSPIDLEDGALVSSAQLPEPLIPTIEDGGEENGAIILDSVQSVEENDEILESTEQSEFEEDVSVINAELNPENAEQCGSKKWNIKVRTDLIDSQKSPEHTEETNNLEAEPELADIQSLDVETESTQPNESTFRDLENEQNVQLVGAAASEKEIRMEAESINERETVDASVQREHNDCINAREQVDTTNELEKDDTIVLDETDEILDISDNMLVASNKPSKEGSSIKKYSHDDNGKDKGINCSSPVDEINTNSSNNDKEDKDGSSNGNTSTGKGNENMGNNKTNNNEATVRMETDFIEERNEDQSKDTNEGDKKLDKNVDAQLKDRPELFEDKIISTSSNESDDEDIINEDEVLKSDEERTESTVENVTVSPQTLESNPITSIENEDDDSQETLVDFNGGNSPVRQNLEKSQHASVDLNKCQDKEVTKEKPIESANNKDEEVTLQIKNNLKETPISEIIHDLETNLNDLEKNRDTVLNSNPELSEEKSKNSENNADDSPLVIAVEEDDENSHVDDEEINLRVVLNGFNEIKQEQTSDAHTSTNTDKTHSDQIINLEDTATNIYQQKQITSKDIKKEILELNSDERNKSSSTNECDLMDEVYPKPSDIPIANYIKEHLMSCTFDEFPEDMPSIIYDVSPAGKKQEMEEGEIANSSEDNLVIDDSALKSKKRKGKRREKRKRSHDDSVILVDESSLDGSYLSEKKRRKKRKKMRQEKKKHDSKHEEKFVVKENLEMRYDPIDTTLGEELAFDMETKTDYIECQHNPFDFKRINWDSNLLKSRTRMVEIYIEALDRNITRPITLEANDSILDISSTCGNVFVRPRGRKKKNKSLIQNRLSSGENKNSNTNDDCDKSFNKPSSSKTSLGNTVNSNLDLMDFCLTMGSSKKLLRKVDVDKFLDMIHNNSNSKNASL